MRYFHKILLKNKSCCCWALFTSIVYVGIIDKQPTFAKPKMIFSNKYHL
jgi:hypothetical protein